MMVIPPVLAGLAWFLLRTDVGVAVRAASENEDRALLLGIPIRRLSTIVWMVAGALAALTFVLKAPFSGVTPGLASAGPLLLLPALAAAVVARMRSEEHTSELQSLMRISYAVFCLKKKTLKSKSPIQ